MSAELAAERVNRTSLLSSENLGYFSIPFEKFREDALSEWTSALTLLDTIETFFDSRLDLLERRLKQHGDKLKVRAEEALKRTRTPLPGEMLYFDKELQKLRMKIGERMSKLATAWHSAKLIRTREKVSFYFGVMNVLCSALALGMAPEWIHVIYTLQIIVLIPGRVYTYKKKQWHYFLFDLCYYSQVLFLIFLWIMPWSPTLLLASYCLSHGSLASAVITWRNSLVFHDADKITSLFIHPPFVFTVIRHFYHDAPKRFPALDRVPTMQAGKALLVSGLIYLFWQVLYWQFVYVARRQKVLSGERATSFSYLLNDKRGIIGRMLGSVQPQRRELYFMGGQLVYAIITEIPCVFVLYDNKFWSSVFLLFIFSVSVWNGAGFYIEVFGRKFERELEALRKELAESEALRLGGSSSGRSTPGGAGTDSSVHSEDESSTDQIVIQVKGDPAMEQKKLV